MLKSLYYNIFSKCCIFTTYILKILVLICIKDIFFKSKTEFMEYFHFFNLIFIFVKKLLSKNAIYVSALVIMFITACQGNKNNEDQQKFEPNAHVRAREFADKNPVTLFKDSKDKNTNFEFGTSNVLWRASLKTLDFIPLVTVDYSGGIIITDWYSEGKLNKEQIKIQVRFLSTDLRSESIQINSYKKICETSNECTNLAGNENFNKEIKDLIINSARQIKIEDNKRK